jgi:hypothetical protein
VLELVLPATPSPQVPTARVASWICWFDARASVTLSLNWRPLAAVYAQLVFHGSQVMTEAVPKLPVRVW